MASCGGSVGARAVRVSTAPPDHRRPAWRGALLTVQRRRLSTPGGLSTAAAARLSTAAAGPGRRRGPRRRRVALGAAAGPALCELPSFARRRCDTGGGRSGGDGRCRVGGTDELPR